MKANKHSQSYSSFYDLRLQRREVDSDPNSFDELEDEVIARESFQDTSRDRTPFSDSEVVYTDWTLNLHQPVVNAEAEEALTDDEHYLIQNSPSNKQRRVSFNRIVSKGDNSNVG